MTTLRNFLHPSPDREVRTDIVDSALETVRRHLGMEVAYLSEFVDDTVIFRAVSAPGLEHLVKPGDQRPLSEVYCTHILEGRLPSVIRDTRDEPLAMTLPITHQVPIRSHVSVPIRREDGSVYGMFCCLSPRPSASLTNRDLEVMELFAAISAKEVNFTLAERARLGAVADVTLDAINGTGFRVVYQPIVNLDTMTAAGFEALCRFDAQPYRSPDKWFTDATEIGMAASLECAVAARALNALDRLPRDVYVSVNAAPQTVSSGSFERILAGHDMSRIVLEVTEQAMVTDYDLIAFALDPLREAGMRLAVDDAGAGYAGLQQILHLHPDFIKLDMSLTRNIDTDPARRWLADALVGFARKTNAVLMAEGIETEAELTALRALGVNRGQGYLLGRPDALDVVMTRDFAEKPMVSTG